MTSGTRCNFAALLFALVCLIGGLDLVRRGVRPEPWRSVAASRIHLGVGLLVTVLAVVHALRGFGALGGPCS